MRTVKIENMPFVIHASDRPSRAPKVPKLVCTVCCRRIYYDVVMDMVFIYMGADNKSMVAFRQFQSKLPANLVCFFRCYFSGLK